MLNECRVTQTLRCNTTTVNIYEQGHIKGHLHYFMWHYRVWKRS